MKRLVLIALLFVACWASAQQVEPVRYEVSRWNKDQSAHFESLGTEGGIMVSETDKTDKAKHRLWSFACVDTSLYELRTELIPLPEKLTFVDACNDEGFVVFLFANNDNKKAADSLDFIVVSFNRKKQTWLTYWDKWNLLQPQGLEKGVPLSVELCDGTLMMAVNSKSGNGNLYFYDLTGETRPHVAPAPSSSSILFQTEAFTERHCFLVAAKVYEDKHFTYTAFLVYSCKGQLLAAYRYENIPKATMGRMGFRFDDSGNLVVIGTLERETGRKVSIEGITENFDKESLGVVWMKFVDGTPESKVYLFKDMPDIERALTGSDRVRVNEERLKKRNKDKGTMGEIAFQLLTPRLTDFGDLTVFSAEAFMPYYHTETRMNYGYYGYYGGYPYTYTVFDGYDFFSEILLAFDKDGQLRWQQSVRFDNELTYNLYPHGAESACYDELVVVSPARNKLRYIAFNSEGKPVMFSQEEKLVSSFGADYLEDEYFAQIERWYGSRFYIYGSQVIQNSSQPKPHRWVYYLQKVQYE